MKKTAMTLSVTVSDFLKKKIILGELEAGSRLREEYIARELGISRIPLREALKNLESEGYISTVPYKGAIVKNWNPDEIAEARELLQSLIPMVLKAAIPKYTEADLIKMDEWYDDSEDWSDQKKLLNLIISTTDIIYGPSKMPFAVSIIKELYVKVFDEFKEIYINDNKALQKTQDQLREFTRLVRNGEYNNALKFRTKSMNIVYDKRKK